MKWVFAALLGALACTSVQAQLIDERPELAYHRWYLTTVYTDPINETCREFKEFMDTDPSMMQLRSQVVYNEWHDGLAIVARTRWANFFGTRKHRPAILLQAVSKANGTAKVVYFNSGTTLKPGPELVREIIAYMELYAESIKNGVKWQWVPRQPCPVRPEPQPLPGPEPSPFIPEEPCPVAPEIPIMPPIVDPPEDDEPLPGETVDEEPVVDEQSEPAAGMEMPLAFPVVVFLAGLAGMYWTLKKESS